MTIGTEPRSGRPAGHRRRHQRRRHRARCRRPRPLGPAVREGRPRQGTSSRSGKLIHGGLRYLEYYEFRLVREALIEREVLLAAAPHIIWPMRFVLPHSPEQRPAWLIRLGLFLYDHLGGRKRLPGDPRARPADRTRGQADPRRVHTRPSSIPTAGSTMRASCVLNALDAAERGATVLTRTALHRRPPRWTASGRPSSSDTRTGAAPDGRARAASSTPPAPGSSRCWAGVAGRRQPARGCAWSRAATSSRRKFWDGPQAYVLQNTDRRVIFVNPYAGRSLPDRHHRHPLRGRARTTWRSSAREIDYLLAAVNRYFRHAADAAPTSSTASPACGRSMTTTAAQPVGRDPRLRVRGRRRRQGRRRCSRSSAARSRPTASSPSMRSTS